MLRRRSIRMRIIVLVLVPVIALIALYAVALSLTLSSFISLRQSADVRNEVTNPVTNVQLQLSAERGLALQYLADPTHARLLDLLSQEPKTDAAVNGFLSAQGRARSQAAPGEQRASEKWTAELRTLHALRTTVVSVGLSRAAAATSYSTLIAGTDVVLTQAVLPDVNNSALIQANDIFTLEQSLQAVTEERDVFAADLANHNYPAADARLVGQLVATHRNLWDQATSSLDRQYLKFFLTDIPAGATSDLANLENQVLGSPRRVMRTSQKAWTSVNRTYAAGFSQALNSASDQIRASGSAQARAVLLRLILIGGLGLIAIVAAIAIAIIVSRALLRQLDELRLSALDLSSVRLPAVLARLRSGQEVDATTETPQLDPGTNEIGQLGRAFNIAAQTAVSAAVDEAQIRRGVNDVFRNLARRNQSLLTRQLELLDAMERRVHDPEELADLFRVDHLTTRMRRHAEGLLIVAGGSSGRIWREPVAVVDVMRAAVAEIEDYTRIRVTSRSSSSIAGHAVADIIHMLAELVENATTFSPANTPVRIESDNVAKGLIVEIEDRGLGMIENQIADINAKLADPPLFDLSGSEQLGLFIAGQLARRHDVKITMRGSAYGGITAVVLIPKELVIDAGYDEQLPAVGLRELGGRPVPQLPAASLADDAAASISSPVSPDYSDATRYILDLETDASSVRTTAAQIDPDGRGTGPHGLFADDQFATEVVSADLVDGEAPLAASRPADSDAHAADSADAPHAADTTHAAGTTDAAASESLDQPASGVGTADHITTGQVPMPIPGQPAHDDRAAGEPVSLLGRAASAGDTLNLPGRSGGSVGWPDRAAVSPDWLKLTGAESTTQTAGSPDGPNWLPRRGAAPRPGSDPPASGSPDDGFAGHEQPLPQRQAPAPDGPFSHDLANTDSFGPVPSEPSPAEIDGLPVRVRQANLAPQLRDQAPTVETPQYVAAPEMPAEQAATVEPSPEAARSFMSALQRGWERGRSMAEHMTDQPDDEQS